MAASLFNWSHLVVFFALSFFTIDKILRGSFIALLSTPLTLLVGLPLLLSHLAGGWTALYTSKRVVRVPDLPDQSGKTVVITGATSGMGKVCAEAFASRGARVIVCGRSKANADSVAKEIRDTTGSKSVEGASVDLSTLHSAHEAGCAMHKQIGGRVHTLVLNAGVHRNFGNSTSGFGLTGDGLEEHVAVNYLAHVAFARPLVDSLAAAAPSRLVVISSMAERTGPTCGVNFDWWSPKNGKRPEDYTDGEAYGSAKLAQALWAQGIALDLEKRGVWVCTCHPGVVSSGLQRAYKYSDAWKDNQTGLPLALRWLRKTTFGLAEATSDAGALTALWCCMADEALASPTGSHFVPVAALGALGHPRANDPELRSRLRVETDAVLLKHI